MVNEVTQLNCFEIMNNFLEELLEKNGNYKPEVMPKTMADLSDASRFTYQTVSSMVEFSN